MENYFNTNEESGETLKESNRKAKTQEEIILQNFRLYTNRTFTPENFEHAFINTPITSIRRAFSNLADPKKWNAIEKTGEMVKGKYGKMIHTWKLK